MAKQFHISGYPDNRSQWARERNIGKGYPEVLVFRSSDNPWHPESVSMTPRQARLIAAELIKAANCAENAETYSRKVS